jgi:hypothetical protein
MSLTTSTRWTTHQRRKLFSDETLLPHAVIVSVQMHNPVARRFGGVKECPFCVMVVQQDGAAACPLCASCRGEAEDSCYYWIIAAASLNNVAAVAIREGALLVYSLNSAVYHSTA